MLERHISQFASTSTAVFQPSLPTRQPQTKIELRKVKVSEADPGLSRCLPDEFLKNARLFPHAIAVICGDEKITYGQLAAWSARIAEELLSSGVIAEEIVALQAVRSLKTVAAMLGILQAQAAYLPIDPTLPEGRIETLLNDAGAKRAVTDEESLLAQHVCHRVSIPACPDAEVAIPEQWQGRPDRLAYVMYTSGSTGNPKGVMIEHGMAMSTITDVCRRFDFSAADRVLALSSFGFDLSVFDIFGTLASGGCVILPTEEEVGNPRLLFQLMQRQQVTVWNSVPALLELLLSSIPESINGLAGDLRLVMLSGDWIGLGLPKRLWAHFPKAKLISLGGATEAAIWSCFYHVREVAADWKSIPYGRPLAGQYFRILDANGNPCPEGAVGELNIGGDGVARGYLNHPELSRERFIPDRFAAAESARLYRTGDLGRLGADGEIELLGRMDYQVKINGYRIELGEIEAQLSKHPRIKEVVVVARGESCRTQLVAYVIAREADRLEQEQSHELPLSEIRLFLAKTLPHYMLPAALVHLQRFPLTANGKVDRTQLPDPVCPVAVVDPSCASGLERQVAELFAQVLRKDVVGVDANLLELGADSIVAMTLSLRLEETFGLRGAATVQSPELTTPRSIARMIQQGHCPSINDSVCRLQPHGSRSPVFCLPGIDGHLLKFRDLAQHLGPDQPVYGLKPPGLDGSDPGQTVEEIAAHYVRLIRGVQPVGPYRILGFSLGGIMAFEAARQLIQAGERVESLVLLDAHAGETPLHSLTARISFVARYLFHLPAKELRPYLADHVVTKWKRLSEWLRRRSGRVRHLDGMNLAPNYQRVALASLGAVQRYQPQPLSGHGILLRAALRPRGRGLDTWNEEMGWTGLFSQGLTVYDVPGSHRDMLREWNVPTLAAFVRELLAAVH